MAAKSKLTPGSLVPARFRDYPEEDQPAYRIGAHGAAALGSTELLQIVLSCELVETPARLLEAAGGLAGLARMTPAELAELPEIGQGRALRLKAAMELGRRVHTQTRYETPRITSPADAANLLMSEMSAYESEHLVVIMLDTRNQVIKVETIYQGSANTALIRVAEIFRPAIRQQAVAIIIAHNHPSGDPSPSPDDVRTTRSVVEAGKLLNIDVLDHLVIGDQRFVSMKERGLGF